jgi:hypothetical protein
MTMKLTNPFWCRRALAAIGRRYKIAPVSLGEEIFLERLSRPFAFETGVVASKLGLAMRGLQRLNLNNWIGRAIIAAQGHYPIYMTFLKCQPPLPLDAVPTQQVRRDQKDARNIPEAPRSRSV